MQTEKRLHLRGERVSQFGKRERERERHFEPFKLAVNKIYVATWSSCALPLFDYFEEKCQNHRFFQENGNTFYLLNQVYSGHNR